jgi:DNA-binding transcriptional regulator GbsR (MarR family)
MLKVREYTSIPEGLQRIHAHAGYSGLTREGITLSRSNTRGGLTIVAQQATSTSIPQRRMTEQARREIIDDMGALWDMVGMPRSDGRVVGCLMLSNEPAMSSADLKKELGMSAATISTVSRRLVDVGYIKRVTQPGQRGHFFRVEDDVWGALLANEGALNDKRSAFTEDMRNKLGTEDELPRRRVTNMRDYMSWLRVYHRKMLVDYEEFKRERAQQGDS